MLTIRDVLQGDAGIEGGPLIYVVRDGEVVFYVGYTATGARFRIGEHLGLWGRGDSPLGRLVRANEPESDAWQVNIIPGGDEAKMIRELHPCLNAALNLQGADLPDRYRKGPEFERTQEHPCWQAMANELGVS